MTERAANEVSQVGRTDQQMNQGWQLGSRHADMLILLTGFVFFASR